MLPFVALRDPGDPCGGVNNVFNLSSGPCTVGGRLDLMRKKLKADEGSRFMPWQGLTLDDFGRFRPFPHQLCFNHPNVFSSIA